MRLTLLFLFSLLSTSCFASVCQSFPKQLSVMTSVDQALRNHLIQERNGRSDEKLSRTEEQLSLIDRINTKKLKKLLKICGWPGKSIYGESAGDDAWLLLQHADHDLKFQIEAIVLLQKAVDQGEASGSHLAYLSDRIATAQKRPQLYGTQFNIIGECGLELETVDDITKVEERRKKLGMPSLAEYRKQMLTYAMPAHCSSPPPN